MSIKLLTRQETAKLLRVKPQTLAAWATRRSGPHLPVVRIHGRALYRACDVESLLHSHTARGVIPHEGRLNAGEVRHD